MYRCGNEVKTADCVVVEVGFLNTPTGKEITKGTTALVLFVMRGVGPDRDVHVSLLFPDESIHLLSSSCCTLCQRK